MNRTKATQAVIPVEGANDCPGPLSHLLDRARSDPSAPFEPEMLQALLDLQNESPVQFEQLHQSLKRAGCRVTGLDKAMAKIGAEQNTQRPKQADRLIELALAADLFHDPDGVAYADVSIQGHRETWPVHSETFQQWLNRRFYDQYGAVPSTQAKQEVLNLITAKAKFNGPERSVHLRTAGLDGKLYLDLCDEAWQAVEIDRAGWHVIASPPVRFRRTPGMQSLPIPESGGSVEPLRRFLNITRESDFILVVTWLLAALRDRGPYPVLVLSGEQGSAKSTFTAILRSLVDPNVASLRAMPRDDRELFIAARNGHLLAFDNLSTLSTATSDTLCRLANGGSFAVRQLYTDQDEVLFHAARPVVLNSIDDIVTRADLADRSLFIALEAITEAQRRPEQQLWQEFNTIAPVLLGALLDAMSTGLERLPATHLDQLPRMADFALWGKACEAGLWRDGAFVAAYQENRREVIDQVIEGNPVASGIRALMHQHKAWTGTATQLLAALKERVDNPVWGSKNWPKTPQTLSGQLKRSKTFLHKTGIDISFSREGHKRTRTIQITHQVAQGSDGPSASSASKAELYQNKDLHTVSMRTTDGDADDVPDQAFDQSVCEKTIENNKLFDADGADDSSPLTTDLTEKVLSEPMGIDAINRPSVVGRG